MSDSMTPELIQLLAQFPVEVQELAEITRSYLLGKLEGCTEIPDASAKVIGYGYGTGYKDTICTLMLSKKGVKIGFYKGASLPDPHQLLTGTGKVHRFVEVKTAAALDDKIDQLMEAALQAYHERITA